MCPRLGTWFCLGVFFSHCFLVFNLDASLCEVSGENGTAVHVGGDGFNTGQGSGSVAGSVLSFPGII